MKWYEFIVTCGLGMVLALLTPIGLLLYWIDHREKLEVAEPTLSHPSMMRKLKKDKPINEHKLRRGV